MLTAVMMGSCLTSFAPVYAETTDNDVSVQADDEQEIEFTYTIKEDGTAEITEWLIDEANIYIPAYVDDMPVTSIADFAFTGLEKVCLICLPDTINSIGDGAFLNCENLKSFVVPDSVEHIGKLAIGCLYDEKTEEFYKMENFVIYGYDKNYAKDYADTLKFEYKDYHELMHYSSFNNKMTLDWADKRIHKIDIPSYVDGMPVTKIQGAAFSECYYLEEVLLPDTLEFIGASAFNSCPLSEIVIPDTVTEVGGGVFENCIYLENVKLSANLSEISYGMFDSCISLESIDLGENITKIDEFAFVNCYSLTEINIPANVTEVVEQAFNNCISLENINVSPDNKLYYSENGVLFKITHWVDADDTITLVCFPCASEITEYTVPDNVREIGKSAFRSCQNLEKVVITENVQRIGSFAFSSSESLEYIEHPKSAWLTESGNYRNCPNLTVYAEDSQNFRSYLEKEGNENLCEIKTLASEEFDIVQLKNYLLGQENCPSPVKDDEETNVFDLILAKKNAMDK